VTVADDASRVIELLDRLDALDVGGSVILYPGADRFEDIEYAVLLWASAHNVTTTTHDHGTWASIRIPYGTRCSEVSLLVPEEVWFERRRPATPPVVGVEVRP